MPNDMRFSRALVAAAEAAPLTLGQDVLVDIVRATLDGADRPRSAPSLPTPHVHHADNGRPDCHERPITNLAVGDRVWSAEGQRFHRVIGTGWEGTSIRLVVYANGDVVRFDLRQARYVLVAIDASAADDWNLQQQAERRSAA